MKKDWFSYEESPIATSIMSVVVGLVIGGIITMGVWL